MLYLTRKQDEVVRLFVPPAPRLVTIDVVVSATGRKTRLGVDAPYEVGILRREVLDRMSPSERSEYVESLL